MKRLLLLITILVVLQVGIIYIKAGYAPPKIASAEKVLQKIPHTIDQWTSTGVELDPELYVSIGASDTHDRSYTNPYGAQVLLHCAGWTEGEEWTPHLPTVCYPNAGWDIKQKRTISLEEFPDAQLCLMEMERQGERIHVLYWYQHGNISYHSRDGSRRARRNLWGKEEWPPVVKVLLQTPALDRKDAEKQLRTVAARVMKSINEDIH